MKKPGQLRELFRMPKSLHERIGVQTNGLSEEDIFAAYVKKNGVNFQRQETGYAVKVHDDSKDI